MRSKETLDITHPELAKQWHPTKNEPLTPDQVSKGVHKKVWWVCDKGHEWDASVNTRTSRGSGCAVCSGRRVQAGANDLATTHPEVAALWHPTLNDKSPSEVAHGSLERAWWTCQEGHAWDSVILQVADRGKRCQVCKGVQLEAGVNDLATTHPGLAAQWVQCKDLTPQQVTAKSRESVTWQCSNGHQWEATPYHRAHGNRGCPFCSGARAIPGTTDLATLNPDLVGQWGWLNDREPSTVLPGSGYRAHWVCESGHEWTTAVSERSLRGTGCPSCAAKAGWSKGELELATLVSERVNIVQHDRSVLGRKELDIVCPDQQVALEFNGLYWHSEALKPQDYHQDKSQAAERAGFQLIHVWEDDWTFRRDVLLRTVFRKLGVSDEMRKNARSLTFKQVPSAEAGMFLDANHIQGRAGGSWRGGLYDGSDLVALMVMKSRGPGRWELVRFATSCIVRGGHSKLLSQFKKAAMPDEITTFSDRGVSDGGLYETCGFTRDGELPPDYMYVTSAGRVHKFNYRVSRFQQDPDLRFEADLTERQLANLNGLRRVYDAGKTRWVWRA